MKIIITDTFYNDYKKFFGKELTNCPLLKICSILNKEVIIHPMYLNRPFMKLKFNFCNKSIRFLVSKEENIDLIIPIFITDKNDKKYGYNMTWNNLEFKVLGIMKKITLDIKNKNYEYY